MSFSYSKQIRDLFVIKHAYEIYEMEVLQLLLQANVNVKSQ
jgi:hypothetical protein